MGHLAGQEVLRLQAPRIRRAFMMFLAFAYLFVGLGHAAAHVREGIPTTISFGMSLTGSHSPDDSDSEQSSAFVEHCHVNAPILMPVAAPVAAPSVHSVQLFLTPNFLLEDHPQLDTPPPKRLT